MTICNTDIIRWRDIFIWRCMLLRSVVIWSVSQSHASQWQFPNAIQFDFTSKLYTNVSLCVSRSACQCSAEGSRFSVCDSVSGQCVCVPNVVGQRCDSCSSGSYNFPLCQGDFACRLQPGLSSHTVFHSLILVFVSFLLHFSLPCLMHLAGTCNPAGSVESEILPMVVSTEGNMFVSYLNDCIWQSLSQLFIKLV